MCVTSWIRKRNLISQFFVLAVKPKKEKIKLICVSLKAQHFLAARFDILLPTAEKSDAL